MTTCSVQGCAVLQEALEGIVTWNVLVPVCGVEAVEPAGNPSASTGWVGDQTGLVMMVGVQLVPA